MEVNGVNKKALTALSLVLAVMFISTTINSVFALEVNEHQYAGGRALIQVPGGPMIRLVMYRLSGDFGRVCDRIHIAVALESNPEAFAVVMGWEDNPDRKAFSDLVGLGDNTLVKRWQIQVITICKTTIAWWTIPLEVPATDDTQAVTVPPGLIILKGSGDKLTSETVTPIVTVTAKESYVAEGKLYCRGWGSVSTTGDWGRVVKDTDWHWTLPDP